MNTALVGTTNLSVAWKGGPPVEEVKMQEYRLPVRRGVKQCLRYTFRDENRNVIDLKDYTAAKLVVKVAGASPVTVPALFALEKSRGEVKCDYTFDNKGTWYVQFYVSRVDGDATTKLFGEPIQLLAVNNVDNLTSEETLAY